jgi:hypothetical protein
MATLSLSGDPDKKKKKKDSGVADCTDGKCGPTTRGKMSISKFSPTKKRYDIPKSDPPPPPKPTGNLHMNMNNLGGNPGDTQMQKYNSKSAVTPAQETEGRKFNSETRKNKKALKLPSRK